MVTQLPLLDLRATPTIRSTRRPVRGATAPGAGSATRRTPARPTPEAPPTERPPVDWRLDEHTREVGRRGVAEARRALAAAVERVDAAA
jgi:hypothetical protein